MAVYQSISYGVCNAVFNAMPKGGGGGEKIIGLVGNIKMKM